MKIAFLGTAGYHPTETRHTSCLMFPEVNLVVDAGTGFFRARDHVKPGRLDILLTHFHSDHTCGLHYLIDVVFEKGIKEVHVWGPRGLAGALDRFFRKPLFPLTLKQLPIKIYLHELTRKLSHTVRGVRIKAMYQDHPGGGSLAYRLEWDKRAVVVVTDTIADPATAEFASGADLLIHECNFRDIMKDRAVQTGHSYSTVVGQYAAAAKVRRLALTHLNPLDTEPEFCLREVMEFFPDTFLASDKMEVTL